MKLDCIRALCNKMYIFGWSHHLLSRCLPFLRSESTPLLDIFSLPSLTVKRSHEMTLNIVPQRQNIENKLTIQGIQGAKGTKGTKRKRFFQSKHHKERLATYIHFQGEPGAAGLHYRGFHDRISFKQLA